MLNQFSRTQLLLGEEGMKKLAGARVAVFGIGGVGGYVCEALVRRDVYKRQGEVLTRCRSKVHDTFDTIQHVGGFPSSHRHVVHSIRSLGC